MDLEGVHLKNAIDAKILNSKFNKLKIRKILLEVFKWRE